MPELVVQQQLGPYLLLRELGQGGMAIVFEALDTRTQQRVALKLLKSPLLTPERRREDIARLGREAEILGYVSSPHVVALHQGLECEEGPVESLHYLVEEYLEGITLRAQISRKRPSPDEALFLLEPVAEALDALHVAGIVYGDLKPSNVMVLRDGGVRLIDFGLARYASDTAVPPVEALVGSPAYLAPEVIAGDGVTGASDIWALGVILYEMLTGSLPFPGPSVAEVLHGIAHRPPAPLPPASAKVERVLRRALEKNPARRYESAHTLMADYAAAIGVPSRWAPTRGAGAAGRKPRAASPRTQRWLWAAAPACALLLVGLALLPGRRPQPPPPAPIAFPALTRGRFRPVRVKVASAIQERWTPRVRRRVLSAAAPLKRQAAPRRRAAVPPPVAGRAVRVARKKHREPVRPVMAALPPDALPLPRVPEQPTRGGVYAVAALPAVGEHVQALNDSGQAVGSVHGQAVVWEAAQSRSVSLLGGGPAPPADSDAAAINDRGQVVGFARSHGFLWQKGRLTDLGGLRGMQSNAAAINGAGEAVGSSDNVAVLWRGEEIVSLGTLGGDESHARAINDAGQVAGVSYLPNGYYHAFLWQTGGMEDLGTLGGRCSMAVAINDQGQVAGLSVTPSGATHAFLWQNGSMEDLGALVTTSEAYGIAPDGEVVGASDGRAVRWRGGQVEDLNGLIGSADGDVVLTRAVAVNARGQILCLGHTRAGLGRAFLLTPNS